jgi:uncharacterized damage-inducible protein DinB
MTTEVCTECGFDGGQWSDEDAIHAIQGLGERFVAAVEGLSSEELQRRPMPERWSIAEYCDHVREVTFAMRFMLDTALGESGADLGEAPEPRFDPQPRAIEVDRALAGIREEAQKLSARLSEIPLDSWKASVRMGSIEHDVHWIARHAVHDATHHLKDIAALRALVCAP